ncbi:UDP-glucosyltransferase 2-like, partial [Maniola jurtina]|uniref:UDP-glucosyltransferase 2-like n=1 Tax=Maniola jurtina TaxID=191418 RepID=UPI001E688979
MVLKIKIMSNEYIFKMVLKNLSVLLILSVIVEIKSAKILAVFPMPSISHQVVFRPLTQELAKKGHDVTVITPNPAFPKGNSPSNLREIDIHDISYEFWHQFQIDYKADGNSMNFNTIRQTTLLLAKMFVTQLQSPEIQALINDDSKKFDLILIEAVMRPALVYSYIFKAPVILVSSLGMVVNYHKVMGMHTHPLLYPYMLQPRIYNLTLTEKLYQIYMYYSGEFADYLNEIDENKILRNVFGSKVPPLSDLYLNIDMCFLNIHPIWADNQPSPSNVLYIGGIHIVPEKELPQDLQEYLDSSKHGVIYLSFGTNVLAEMIPPDKIRVIINVLSKLPFDVLWKWDKNELPERSSNIRISNWFPQADILRHPKVKLFITQAGLQSTDEAINAGVPLVAIPMLGDQWYNAEKYVKYGIGKKLDIKSLTAEELKSAVETVIKDYNYRNNIIKLREYQRDQLMPPLEKAVWWTEYVIRHGGAKHLRSSGANVSYTEYFELEILFIVISAVLTVLISIILILVLFVKLIKKMISYK